MWIYAIKKWWLTLFYFISITYAIKWYIFNAYQMPTSVEEIHLMCSIFGKKFQKFITQSINSTLILRRFSSIRCNLLPLLPLFVTNTLCFQINEPWEDVLSSTSCIFIRQHPIIIFHFQTFKSKNIIDFHFIH